MTRTYYKHLGVCHRRAKREQVGDFPFGVVAKCTVVATISLS